MRPLALLLALAVLGAPFPARAAEPAPARGWRTGLGVSLLAVGAGAVGFGLAGVLVANDAQARANAYALPGPDDLAQTLPVLRQQRDTFTTLAAVGFVAGALLLGGGVTLLALDGRPAAVALVPTRDGAFVSLALRL